MEICFRGTCPPGSAQPSGTVFTFLVAKRRPQLPSAPMVLPSIFGTFQILVLQTLSPIFWVTPSPPPYDFLDCTGALEFHIPSIFSFVVCALGIRATEPCLGALFCYQFLHTASGPSLPNSSSIFRARGVLSCGRSFRMWCQLCRVPSSHGNLLTLNLLPGPLSP